jgi:hypothetical protein
MPHRKRVILKKNVIAVFDPDYQCFVAVAEPFLGARWAAAYLSAFRACVRYGFPIVCGFAL